MTFTPSSSSLRTLVACSAVVLFASVAAASPAPVAATAANAEAAKPAPADVFAAVSAGIAKLNPQASAVQSVTTSPIPGVYEVFVDGQLFYSDAKGQNIVFGQMIDTGTKSNLTSTHLDNKYKLPPNALPTRDAFVSYRTGDGSNKVLVFEDPDCHYCKQLEPELQKLKNTTVYVMMIEILGESSKVHGHSIACAADSGKAWVEWMNNGNLPAMQPPATCDGDATVVRNAQLAQKLGVNSTPTYYFMDGTRARGNMPAEELQKKVDESAAALASAH